jgi:hypothetical protein
MSKIKIYIVAFIAVFFFSIGVLHTASSIASSSYILKHGNCEANYSRKVEKITKRVHGHRRKLKVVYCTKIIPKHLAVASPVDVTPTALSPSPAAVAPPKPAFRLQATTTTMTINSETCSSGERLFPIGTEHKEVMVTDEYCTYSVTSNNESQSGISYGAEIWLETGIGYLHQYLVPGESLPHEQITFTDERYSYEYENIKKWGCYAAPSATPVYPEQNIEFYIETTKSDCAIRFFAIGYGPANESGWLSSKSQSEEVDVHCYKKHL